MGHIADLRARAQRRTSNLYDTYFTRRVSIYVTAVLAPLGVSANTVSAIGCLVAIAACTLLALGDGATLLLGVGLVHLVAVLDSVDGELARLRRTFTLRGLFLEDLCAFTMLNGFAIAVGAYLSRQSGSWVPLALGVGIAAFGRNALQVARRAWLKSIATARPLTDAQLALLAEVPGEAAPRRLDRARALGQAITFPTNLWVLLSTAMAIEQLVVLPVRLVWPLAAAVAGLLVAKELATIWVYATTDELDRELVRIYQHAARRPDQPVGGIDLAGG